jgi:hypothetical protein
MTAASSPLTVTRKRLATFVAAYGEFSPAGLALHHYDTLRAMGEAVTIRQAPAGFIVVQHRTGTEKAFA